MEIKFCPTNEFESKVIELLQKNIVHLSSNAIQSIYSMWRNEYNALSLKGEGQVVYGKEVINSSQNVPGNAYMTGIDFPVWLNSDNGSNKKILVLGLDPMRNERTFVKDFKVTLDKVIVGAPYALQLPAFRTGRTKQYWNFLSSLAQNYTVYLTDIYKCFFYYANQQRSYDYYSSNFSYEQRVLLRMEIEMIDPSLIIVLGRNTFEQLTGKAVHKITDNVLSNTVTLFDKYQTLGMPHLSGRVFKKHLLQFFDNNDIPQVNSSSEGYLKIIDKYSN